MNDFLTFAVAVVGLLAVPGPTNTLLATAGAAQGARQAYTLLPGEIGGYLVAIGFLTQVLAPLVADLPAASLVMKGIAGFYLAWLSVRLWRDPASATDAEAVGAIRLRDVFLTTLLNPKALIFAFVIFPRGDAAALLPYAALFSSLVVACGGAWVTLGGVVRRTAGGFATRALVARVGAGVLAAFSLVFMASVIADIVR